MDESFGSSTFLPWLEAQLHCREWTVTKLEKLSAIRCCKILRESGRAFHYLFIHSLNKYLMKIWYISDAMLY